MGILHRVDVDGMNAQEGAREEPAASMLSVRLRNTAIAMVLLLPAIGFLVRMYAFSSVQLPDADFVAWSAPLSQLIFTGFVATAPLVGYGIIFFGSLWLARSRGWSGAKRRVLIVGIDSVGALLLLLFLPGWPGTLAVAVGAYVGFAILASGVKGDRPVTWMRVATGILAMVAAITFAGGTWGPLPLNRAAYNISETSSMSPGEHLELGRTEQTLILLRCQNMWNVYEVPYSEIKEGAHQSSDTSTISLLDRLQGEPGRRTHSPLRCFWNDLP